MALDVFLGRALAFCVHPCSAWPRLDVRGRTLIVATYFTTAYVVVLGMLFVF